jgi:hypothetical protein
MGQEFPYTPEGMAAAEQYRQTLGMRDGGMMGFRPIGMQEGGVPLTDAQKIERIMELTGMQNPGVLLDLTSDELDRAWRVMDWQRRAQQQEQADPTPTEEERAAQDAQRPEQDSWKRRLPGFDPKGDYYPPERWEQPKQPLSPQGQPDVTEPLGLIGDPELHELLKRLDRDIGAFQENPIRPPTQNLPPMQNQPRLRGMERMPPYMMDPRFEGYYNPNQLNPYFNPNEIAVANGGYITRDRNRGGLMSLRRR